MTDMDGKYFVAKRFDHNLGLSCTFRQWRDSSHCRFLHGYALAVTLRFACNELDERGWVIPFGGFASIKQYLAEHFDHKTLVAQDDPQLPTFRQMHREGIIQLVEFPDVGCERFAYYIGCHVVEFLLDNEDYRKRGVRLLSCSVSEHSANEVTWVP